MGWVETLMSSELNCAPSASVGFEFRSFQLFRRQRPLRSGWCRTLVVLGIGRRQIEITPIDAKVVPLLGEDGLFPRAQLARRSANRPRHILGDATTSCLGSLTCDFGRGPKPTTTSWVLPVTWSHVVGHISHGPRIDHQVLRQGRGHECERQPTPALKSVDGSCGQTVRLFCGNAGSVARLRP